MVHGHLARPAVVHHKLGQRWPPVRAIVPARPAKRDDRGALDVVGDAEDRVEARLATAVQRREAAPEPQGSSRQQDILHAGVDGGARLEAGPARGKGVDTSDDRTGAAARGCRAPPADGAGPAARASSYTSLIAFFTAWSRTTIKCQGWVLEPEGPWIAAVKT